MTQSTRWLLCSHQRLYQSAFTCDSASLLCCSTFSIHVPFWPTSFSSAAFRQASNRFVLGSKKVQSLLKADSVHEVFRGFGAAGESLGQALDRAFAERIKLPKGDAEHAGAPIQDTRAAPIPSPPSSPSNPEQAGDANMGGDDGAEGGAQAAGSVAGPTETSAAGIAQAGHEETEAVDPSMSSAAMHSAGPTGMYTYELHTCCCPPHPPTPTTTPPWSFYNW